MKENKSGGVRAVLQAVAKWPQTSIVVALVVLYVILYISSPSFFTPNNMVNVLRQSSTTIIVGIGITFILAAGLIDLSVGSLACVGAIVCSAFLTGHSADTIELLPVIPIPFAILAGMAVPAAFGSVNGLVITRLKLPPFIVTMAMMEAARGAILVFTRGYPVSSLPAHAVAIGRGTLLGIPYTVFIMLVLIVIFGLILGRTKYGRYVYAIGGNEECARLSGIKVEKTKIALYTLNGALAGVAGILVAFRMASAQTSIGESYGIDAICACCLGGTALGGGKGYMLGTVLGCLFLTSLSTGFNLMGVNTYWQQIIKGVVLIVAISLSARDQIFAKSKKVKTPQQQTVS